MPPTPPHETLPIEQHGIIGDMKTIALVAMDGTLDFMCFPNFDSPSVFASLLDTEVGGCFHVQPELQDIRYTQMYLPDTAILLTRFLANEGVAELSDFMPVGTDPSQIIRRIKVIRGTIRFRVDCRPRFGYAKVNHNVQQQDNAVIFVPEEGEALRLVSTQPLNVQDGDVSSTFELKAGEKAFFILQGCVDDTPFSGIEDYVSGAFKTTMDYWRTWIGSCLYQGRWRDVVQRSALTLKLLTSSRWGSIIAAPTFGLPETIGGIRNWDYRYTWIRDTAFTLYAFLRLGHTEEASAFTHWLHARCGPPCPQGPLQVMYAPNGTQELTEYTLEAFRGYRDSKPVRVGNAAYDQLQLDIYGTLMDAVYLSNKTGEEISHETWQNLVDITNWVCDNWKQADDGIWEVRGKRREFLHSRVMCWVTLDRALRIARKRGLPGPLAHWEKVRDTIYTDVHAHFWNNTTQTFVQYKGGKSLDASMLLMPLVKFIAPTDPRWLSTLKAIGETLVQDSLVFRYNETAENIDGLQGMEGTFTTCSFWYIECLARSGDVEQARFLFEKQLGYANHLFLYSEELGPKGEHLGNFPQALTHLALISTAYYLNKALS